MESEFVPVQKSSRTYGNAEPVNEVVPMLAAAAGGALLMYFMDPERGNRRQKRLLDRAIHLTHVGADFLQTASRDSANRARGVAAVARSALKRQLPDDRVLEERVRAELGRLASHPGAIDVSSTDGVVSLAGHILRAEHDDVVQGVGRVRDVESVADQLAVHETAENVPALQGPGRPPAARSELAQTNWSPAIRLLTGIAGATLASYGMRQRGPIGSILAAGGLALLGRALTNLELDRLVGVGGGRQGVDIQKTINIAAPIDDVFAVFTEWERWPEWMSHVQSVSASGARGAIGEQIHWEVDGPAGTTVSWNAEITDFVTNKLVSWRSVEGAAIRQAGTLRFDENEDGTVRVDIHMTYNPPGGAAGHAVAKLFARDPRRQMNADLARLKTTIEVGKAPHDAASGAGR